jgi:hypothetical protein
MRDTVFQAATQSHTKPEFSERWYSFIYSAVVAGFEAYGLAQIGISPASMPANNPGLHFEERSLKRVGKDCMQPGGCESSIDPVLGVHPPSRRISGNAVWSQA